MTPDTTSISLLERLKGPRQKEAWDRFVDLYGPFLHEWACRLGAPPEDAADLVQEVFLVVLAKLPEFQYDRTKSFRGFLRTITRNKWLDIVRRRKTAVGAANDGELEQAISHDSLESLWETEHRQYLVRRGLEVIRSEFEATSWQACWDFVVGHQSAAEVAARLGLSENAVYIAKHRVLRRLRQELTGLLD